MDQEQKEKLKKQVMLDNNVISLYDYGSTVYGTRTEKSDTDVIMVVVDKNDNKSYDLLKEFMDVNLYSEAEFGQYILEHEITALECIFLEEKNIWKNTKDWEFNLYLPTLRSAVSSKSSNSWVKAKKKFIVEKDFNEYIGKKSAWHAIRILDFGQQIGEKGKIYDFGRVNHLLPQIMECKSWQEIDNNFRSIYNEAGTKFKLVAPKEINNKIKF